MEQLNKLLILMFETLFGITLILLSFLYVFIVERKEIFKLICKTFGKLNF